MKFNFPCGVWSGNGEPLRWSARRNPSEEDVCCNVRGEDPRGEHFIFSAAGFVLCHRGFILKKDSIQKVKKKDFCDAWTSIHTSAKEINGL